VTREFSKDTVVAVPLANTRSLKVKADSDADYKIDSLAKTSKIILRVKNVKVREDLKGISKERLEDGVFDVVAVSQKNKATDSESSPEARVAVVGSAQLASNFGGQTSQNYDLFLNLVNYLTRDESYISIRPKNDLKTSLNLTSEASQVTLQLVTYIYPFAFLFFGLLFWMRRRKA
jgi:ABC-type uncharacterized transport system involved in gliding motility auxiliary subunit